MARIGGLLQGCIIHNYEFKYNCTARPLHSLFPEKPHALPLDQASPTRADAATWAAPVAAPKLQRRALYVDVAERLRAQIFNRALEPGSWIDEQKLSLEYGISRTPLREALKVLAVEGLVTMKVRRGAYVTEMSQADVAQAYHLLGLLESDAAAMVATHANDEQREHLRALHHQLEKQHRQRDAFFATNERFHMALLSIAGNRWALQTVTDLRKVMKLNRHHSLFKTGRISDSLAEHRELMVAIEKRDARGARSKMQRHFLNGLEAAGA
jgi:DNA-binding GntR family transcriptional regulator